MLGIALIAVGQLRDEQEANEDQQVFGETGEPVGAEDSAQAGVGAPGAANGAGAENGALAGNGTATHGTPQANAGEGIDPAEGTTPDEGTSNNTDRG